ncbi:MAG: lipopolysaccharide biosynthesis protein [Rhodospirillaceae bacterium]
MATGSAWMVAMRWSIRGIGLLATITLVRLLTPADFGMVAMAMLVVGLIEVFSSTGQQFALIRHPDPNREHFDTAWTISVLIGLALGGIVLLVAPLAQYYFREPAIVDVIRVLSIRVFIMGFENIGTVMFRRNLDFAAEFRFNVYKKLVPFVITLTLALIWRNYWALVVGIVVGQVAGVVLSYIVHPFRPRFRLTRTRDLWSFSIWVLINHIGAYGQGSVDQLVIGGVVPPQIMGQYTIGAELASLPTTEIVDPIGRALFPVMSGLNHDSARLRLLLLDVLGLIAVLSTAAATGLALVADDLVIVMLGDNWREMAPLIPGLAFTGALVGFANVASLVFNAVGDPRRGAMQSWLCTALLLPTMIIAVRFTDLEGVVMARLIVWLIILPVSFHYLLQLLPITRADVAAVIWRPIVAAAMMAWVLSVLPFDAVTIPALRLGLRVITGAAVYGAVLMAAWQVAGRPGGVERLVIAAVSGRQL